MLFCTYWLYLFYNQKNNIYCMMYVLQAKVVHVNLSVSVVVQGMVGGLSDVLFVSYAVFVVFDLR